MAHDRMRRAYGKRQKRDARPCLNAVAAAASGAEVRRKLRGPGIAVTAENGKKTLKMQSGKERRRNRGDAVLPCDGRRKALSAASAFADALAACQNAPSFACAIGERDADDDGAAGEGAHCGTILHGTRKARLRAGIFVCVWGAGAFTVARPPAHLPPQMRFLRFEARWALPPNHFMRAKMWIFANIPYKKLVGSQFCRITKEPIHSDELFCTNQCRYSWRTRRDLNPRSFESESNTLSAKLRVQNATAFTV